MVSQGFLSWRFSGVFLVSQRLLVWLCLVVSPWHLHGVLVVPQRCLGVSMASKVWLSRSWLWCFWDVLAFFIVFPNVCWWQAVFQGYLGGHSLMSWMVSSWCPGGVWWYLLDWAGSPVNTKLASQETRSLAIGVIYWLYAGWISVAAVVAPFFFRSWPQEVVVSQNQSFFGGQN